MVPSSSCAQDASAGGPACRHFPWCGRVLPSGRLRRPRFPISYRPLTARQRHHRRTATGVSLTLRRIWQPSRVAMTTVQGITPVRVMPSPMHSADSRMRVPVPAPSFAVYEIAFVTVSSMGNRTRWLRCLPRPSSSTSPDSRNVPLAIVAEASGNSGSSTSERLRSAMCSAFHASAA
jgi:hypothetical protein